MKIDVLFVLWCLRNFVGVVAITQQAKELQYGGLPCLLYFS